MMLTRETPSTQTRTYSIVTLLAANPTWTALELNPGLSAERLATNRQSHGTAIEEVAKLSYFAKHQHSNNTATPLNLEGRTVKRKR